MVLGAYRRLFAANRGYRGRLVLGQVLLLVSGACSIGAASLTQRIIDQGLIAGDTDVIITTGIWMAVLAAVAGASLAAAGAISVFFMQGVAWYIRTELFSKIQEYSFENFDRMRTGNLLTRLSSDVDNVSWAVLFGTLLILYAPFMVIIAFILTAIQSPSLLWLLVVASLLVLALMAVVAPRIDKAYVARQERLDDVNTTLQESLTGIRVTKAFARETAEVERFGQRAEALRRPAFTAAFWLSLIGPLITASAFIVIMLSLWFGGWRVLDGSLALGELIAFSQYLTMVLGPLATLAIVVPFILRGGASLRRLLEAYDEVPTVRDDADAAPLSLGDVKGRVAFEDVCFAFRRPDGTLDPPALKDVSLTIEPGERVGILGATGAGKTALVNLLPRFYEVTSGRITIDGVDIREIPQDNLRRIVGIALQEPVLFQGDVRFNLKFGAPDVDDDVMEGAAEAAAAAEFVTSLPDGWAAAVARRGYNFSGGQRQRLSIARTLAPTPRVLVLDDSTSALDVATESRVQEAIPVFARQATTIYVAQRISAVIDLDKVVLMDRGEIVAAGTHEELLERSELYREIYESQLGGGIVPRNAEVPA